MQESYKLHILKMILLYGWTHMEHYKLERQSAGLEKNEILHTWNAVSTKMANFRCSSWRWKTCR